MIRPFQDELHATGSGRSRIFNNWGARLSTMNRAKLASFQVVLITAIPGHGNFKSLPHTTNFMLPATIVTLQLARTAPQEMAHFGLQKPIDSFHHHATCCLTSCTHKGQCLTNHQWLKHIVFAAGCIRYGRFPAMHVLPSQRGPIQTHRQATMPNVYRQRPEMATLHPALKIRLDVVADNRQPSSPVKKC